MKVNHPPIVVSKHITSELNVIWQALTELPIMREWYFPNIDHFKPEIGSRSSFLIENEGRQFTHKWEVVELDAPHKISYTWSYEEYPGSAIVTFEIGDDSNNEKTVTVSLEVKEDFPDGIPEFKRESCMAGWEYFMGRLKSFIES